MTDMLTDGWTVEDAEAVLAGTDRDAIARALVAIAMDPPEEPVGWAEVVMARFATHEDEFLRGDAILGFGHIARITGSLDRPRAEPLLLGALGDPSAFVRGHARSALDDIAHFLGWHMEAAR